MIKGHFSGNQGALARLFSCAFLLIAISALVPTAAWAQSAASVCIEDGGQADCTLPQIVDRPGEYALWEYRSPANGGNALWPGLNSDQDISNQITSLNGGCPTPQTPMPPYTWNLLPYNGSGELVYQTPNIAASLDWGNNCTQPNADTFWGQRIRPISCPIGWISGLGSSPTTNYPDGYCWRPRVQCCQRGQYPQQVGDPIDPALDTETEEEDDYGSTETHLKFVRTYHSTAPITGPGTPLGAAGEGWAHTYEGRLWFYPGGAIRALRPNGDDKVFRLVNGQYQESGTAVDQLIAVQTGGVTTGWEFIGSDDSKEFYDTSGNLLSITYRGGASVSMTYSTASTPVNIAPYAGLLITVSDAFGHQLNFTYNVGGQIATMTDPSGAVYTYTYSGAMLSQVEYPDSSSKQYVYNEPSETDNTNIPYALTGIIDENGSRYATIGYYYTGQAISSQLAGGVDHFTAGGYSIQGFVNQNESETATVTDPLSTSRRYMYQAINGVVKYMWMAPGCPKCSGAPLVVSYDVNGNASATWDDSNTIKTVYSYDLTRNLETSRTEASGTAQARTITTQWDPNWREPDLVTESNHTTAYTYDSLGNVLTKTITDTASNTTRTWTYTYDSYGRVLTAQDPRGNPTTYTYYTCATGYQCGALNTVTDALGHVTTYDTYDGNGRPLTITDPNGTVTTLTYDSRGRPTSRTVGGETTSFSYYPTGLLDQVSLPDGSSISYTYDAAHRLTQVGDGLGNKIVYTLDAMGNRTAENSYDPSGTLHRTHTRVINTSDEIYQEINAAGTSAVTTTFGYDANGNIKSIAAPLSRNTAKAYDALMRVSSITDPASGASDLSYDAEDDLISVKDPRGLTTSYGYDGFGDLTSQVSPDIGSTTDTYDSAGNLATSTDARGAVATYGYDALNRVTSIAYSLNGTTDQTLSLTYDQGTNGIGYLTGASDANHSMSFSYDALGEMTGMSQTVGAVSRSIEYGYTTADLTSITTPSGQTVTYGYNANHQVTSIAVNGTPVLSSVSYEPFGPVDGWTWGNGSAFSRSFSSDGLITGISSPGSQEGLSYDNASRISGITNTASGASSWTYGYDLLDRLTSAASSSKTEGWTYDANGNRRTETGTTPSTYSIGSTSNEITGITGTLARSYAYDAAGNTLSDSADTDTYNDAGRLKTITNTSGTTTFVYNALGQLIQASSSSATILYTYDQAGHLLGEYDGAGNLIQETVWLGDIPVATLRPSGSSIAIYYVETDQLNTPRAIVRPSDNALMWTWFSGPFGVETPNTNPQGAGTFTYDLRLPGQIAAAWGSTFQNESRDYDPAVGRYVESDPIGLDGGSYSTYSYGLGNPLSNTDPTGLAPPAEPDPYALPPGPFEFPTPGTPSNQAWAQNAASQMGQGAEDAVNAIRSICDSDCLQIEAQITKVAAELRWRYYEALIDRKLLYQLARQTPLSRRSGSWLGHKQQFEDLQKALSHLIDEADAKGCLVTPSDRALAMAPYPDTPAGR